VIGQICDVSDEASIDQFISNVENAFGQIEVLVNNAGFGIFKPVHELSEQEFDSVIATNLRGVFLMTKRVLPKMRSRKSGSIVTISSLAGKNGFAGGAAYCAAKFGVRGLMQSVFLEAREDNIRVITIFPGSVETDFFTTAHAGSIRSKSALQAEDVAEAVVAAVALSAHADISELDIRPTNPKA
jgi:3-oxoacyl-[acyl-carrier protein] reductase